MANSASGNNSKTDLVTYRILTNGKEINSFFLVTKIETELGVNRISSARIELVDGDPSQSTFDLSESDTFSLGSNISIKAGYHTEDSAIFSGVVIGQSLQLDEDGSSRLLVECKGKEVKLTVGRKTVVHNTGSPIKDSDVLKKLIADHGVKCTIPATSLDLKELVQHYCTDWDFLLTRAEANGLVVIPTMEEILLKKYDTSAKPVLTLTYGDSLLRFDLEMDARYQYSAISSSFWDESSQKSVIVNANKPTLTELGKDSSQSLASVVGLSALELSTAAPLSNPEAQQWVNAQWAKSYLSKIRGSVVCEGSSEVVPGDLIELRGLGARFCGNAYVSGVKQLLEGGDWTTELSVGIDEKWFVERQPDSLSPLSSPLLPGIQGLCHGIVTKTNEDPEQQFRVEVSIPSMHNKKLWARLVQSFASTEYGSFIYPDINDEVVVGFMGGDPRFPVILGCLHSKTRKPAYVPDAANTKKAWVSKEKLTIEFDDEKKIITIMTAGKNQFVLDDTAKSVSLKDQHGNSIELSESGITITSKKAITLSADSSIDLKSTQNTTVDSKGDLKLDALNIAGQAKGQMTLKGNAMLEVSASGQTIVKGAIVLIN